MWQSWKQLLVYFSWKNLMDGKIDNSAKFISTWLYFSILRTEVNVPYKVSRSTWSQVRDWNYLISAILLGKGWQNFKRYTVPVRQKFGHLTKLYGFLNQSGALLMDFYKIKCHSLILLWVSISVSNGQVESCFTCPRKRQNNTGYDELLIYLNRRYMVPAITLYLFCCTAGRISYVMYRDTSKRKIKHAHN